VADGSINQASARTVKHVYELIGGQPTLDLVNTLDWRFREEPPAEELLTDYGAVLRFAGQSGLIGNSQARRLLRSTSEHKAGQVVSAVRELREAAATVLYASLDGRETPPSTVATLERYFQRARQAQRLRPAEAKLAWELPSTASLPELPLWLLSLRAVELMTSNEMEWVRACGNPECRWLFLDTSKNHTRRWCDMKICGNRMKARRFKAHQARTA
jgi:predicted RNA-binding Zn ribbon-like protein